MSSKSNGLKNIAQFFIDIYWKRESFQVVWSFQGMRKARTLEKTAVKMYNVYCLVDFPYNMNVILRGFKFIYTYISVYMLTYEHNEQRTYTGKLSRRKIYKYKAIHKHLSM